MISKLNTYVKISFEDLEINKNMQKKVLGFETIFAYFLEQGSLGFSLIKIKFKLILEQGLFIIILIKMMSIILKGNCCLWWKVDIY